MTKHKKNIDEKTATTRSLAARVSVRYMPCPLLLCLFVIVFSFCCLMESRPSAGGIPTNGSFTGSGNSFDQAELPGPPLVANYSVFPNSGTPASPSATFSGTAYTTPTSIFTPQMTGAYGTLNLTNTSGIRLLNYEFYANVRSGNAYALGRVFWPAGGFFDWRHTVTIYINGTPSGTRTVYSANFVASNNTEFLF